MKAKPKPEAAKKPKGRPSKYTPELAAEICERLGKGEPLTVICSGKHMPCDNTVRVWAERDAVFSGDIARARSRGYDALAAECLQIANTPLEGVETTTDDKGTTEKRADMLGHRKLQIETRLKLLAKWDPKRYGDKLALGGDPDAPPIRTESTLTITAEEAYKRMLNGG